MDRRIGSTRRRARCLHLLLMALVLALPLRAAAEAGTSPEIAATQAQSQQHLDLAREHY